VRKTKTNDMFVTSVTVYMTKYLCVHTKMIQWGKVFN